MNSPIVSKEEQAEIFHKKLSSIEFKKRMERKIGEIEAHLATRQRAIAEELYCFGVASMTWNTSPLFFEEGERLQLIDPTHVVFVGMKECK